MKYINNSGNKFYICKTVISNSHYGKFNFNLHNTLIFGPSSLRECKLKLIELEINKINKYTILEYINEK